MQNQDGQQNCCYPESSTGRKVRTFMSVSIYFRRPPLCIICVDCAWPSTNIYVDGSSNTLHADATSSSRKENGVNRCSSGYGLGRQKQVRSAHPVGRHRSIYDGDDINCVKIVHRNGTRTSVFSTVKIIRARPCSQQEEGYGGSWVARDRGKLMTQVGELP